jgi:Uma2 family endonuclease
MSGRRPRGVSNARETEAEYEKLPEGTPAAILDGELVVLPRPRPEHTRAAGRLYGELEGPFDRARSGPGGWLLLVEPELHLGPRPDKLAPDLSGWRRERLPTRPSQAAISIAPDWVCEVLSPGGEGIDRVRKARIYCREAVMHYWIVDPVQQTLEVMRNERGRWLIVETHEASERVRAEPFDAIELDLAAVFSW